MHHGQKTYLALIALLAVFAPTAEAKTAHIFYPSQLNVDPQSHDGKTLVVKGYLRLAPELHVLVETRAIDHSLSKLYESGIYNKDDDKYCLTIMNPGVLLRPGHDHWRLTEHTLTLKGRYVANYMDGTVVGLGACDNAPGFEIQKIIKIEK